MSSSPLLIIKKDTISPYEIVLTSIENNGLESPESHTSADYVSHGQEPVFFKRPTPKLKHHSFAHKENLLKGEDHALTSLKIEIADKQQEIHTLINTKIKAEERYKDDIWNLEVQNQDLLQKIHDLSQQLAKSSLEQTRLCQQEKKLSSELEQLKAVRDNELKMTKQQYEQEIMMYKKMVFTQRQEKEQVLKELQHALVQQKEEQESTCVVLQPITNLKESLIQQHPTLPTLKIRSPQIQRNEHLLEAQVLKASLEQAHDIIQTMQAKIDQERQERIEVDKLLREAQEIIEHHCGKSLPVSPSSPTINKTKRNERRWTPYQKPCKSLSDELGHSMNGMEQDKQSFMRIELEASKQDIPKQQVMQVVPIKDPIQSTLVMPLKPSCQQHNPVVPHEKPMMSLEQPSTTSLDSGVITSDMSCQTSPQLHKPIQLESTQLHSFTNHPEEQTVFPSVTSGHFGILIKEPESYIYSSSKAEDDESIQQQSLISTLDFETRSSLDLLLEPLSNQQVQGVSAALTRSMIGNWMYKYKRKMVGTGISEKKHRRFFWINPYTYTLYWSLSEPSATSQSQVKSGKETGFIQ
ncbi:hypothetical protein CU098_009047 [Rhizopus stolonifer]|uniref:Pleckstrin homology domain-containing protein n=1 Tax=Rhizopus stolonifer TaxID=4846 RepID=A0A367KS00_RHIST|nr:hypothetical protein CU098_009047 [Rhizopus stolonifer]